MTNNFKTAFDGIRAEDDLKANTLRYLIQKQNGTRHTVRRLAVSFASVVVILLLGVFYLSPSAYVDVDVNPSVELTLNRFDLVIGAHAYNGDGESILSGLSLKHKSYKDALIILMDAINQKGYLQNDGLVSVTLQTNNADKESELLANIQTGVTDYMAHHTTRVDVFPVNDDTRSHAHELSLSPAKYLAIQELIEANPTATVESCRSHSVSEIKQLTLEHTGNHHGGDNAVVNDEPTSSSLGNRDSSTPHDTQDSTYVNDHHGDDNGSDHHGGSHS